MTTETDQATELVELASVDPKLIQQLFDEDPLKLTDQDLDTIVQFFRQDRMNYLQASAEPKAKKSTKQAVVPLGQIDLSELGL